MPPVVLASISAAARAIAPWRRFSTVETKKEEASETTLCVSTPGLSAILDNERADQRLGSLTAQVDSPSSNAMGLAISRPIIYQDCGTSWAVVRRGLVVSSH